MIEVTRFGKLSNFQELDSEGLQNTEKRKESIAAEKASGSHVHYNGSVLLHQFTGAEIKQ